ISSCSQDRSLTSSQRASSPYKPRVRRCDLSSSAVRLCVVIGGLRSECVVGGQVMRANEHVGGARLRREASGHRRGFAAFGAASVKDLAYGTDGGRVAFDRFGHSSVQLGRADGFEQREQAPREIAEVSATL